MILSNRELQAALDRGALGISPEPSPRERTALGVPCPYDTCSVDLRLGKHLSVPPDKPYPMAIDLRKGGIAPLLGRVYDQTEIPGEGYTLEPGRFVLGQTLERVEFPLLPAGQCLAGRVEGKSSFARCGLLVHFTAPTIHSGFMGTITLEMANFGPSPILLFPEMYICQLIVEKVEGEPFENESEFQDQSTPPGVK